MHMCQALVLIRWARKLGRVGAREARDVLMGCIMQAGNGERNAFRFMGGSGTMGAGKTLSTYIRLYSVLGPFWVMLALPTLERWDY